MFGIFDKAPNHPQSWETLDSLGTLESIIEKSHDAPIVIFKHSTRCSISSMAKSRLEGASDGTNPTIYYLDLIANRDISNEVASKFGVEHESPQILVIRDGKATFNTSHGGISMDVIKQNTL